MARSKDARLAKKQATYTNPIPVLPYQERWIRDDSQLKVAVWSRQSGKSFAAALRAVIKCVEKRTQYIILSKGERQSRLFMEKVKDFCNTFKELKLLRDFEELPETDEKTMEVFFPHNRSRIIGLPANPDTARGYTGHIVLDEFAFHGDAHKIYAACFPIITRGYSIEVISTPNGTAGKFYEIAKQAGLVAQGSFSSPAVLTSDRQKLVAQGSLSSPAVLTSDRQKPQGRTAGPALPSIWSGHKVNIYDAVAQGLEADINLLRAGCDDEETWLQEYCCEFVSDAANYIPLELISSCVSEQATTEWDVAQGSLSSPAVLTQKPQGRTAGPALQGDLYLGVDIGRKRDLTIAWLFEKVGDVLWSRVLLEMKGVTFDDQERAICDLIEGVAQGSLSSPAVLTQKPQGRTAGPALPAVVRRVSVDQSGLGMMLAEHLVEKYGEVVEPVTFTAQLKERLAPMVKQAFEERTVRIPDNRAVRADLNAVKRYVTPAGNVRFDAEHSERGHADRFWALAQVISAATHPPARFSEQAFLAGEPVMRGFAALVL